MSTEANRTTSIISETSISDTICKDKSTPTQRIAKNSAWLILQTLTLNFISIFATAYIARTLGRNDYGKFVFAFSFIGLFAPIVNLGLRAITVREVTENKGQAAIYLGKMFSLKFILSTIAFLLTIWAINFMHYPYTTKIIVYFASLTIIFSAITATFKDAFQGFEKMKYVAYTEFISGFVLTILSVIVLFVGYRLIGLTLVYIFGSFLAMVISTCILMKRFCRPKINIDFPFGLSNIKKGIHFFLPNIINSVGSRFGVILLSKLGGDISIGIYGAASNLTSRLTVLEDGISTAYYPTMVGMFKESKENSAKLFTSFFQYLFLLGFPISICGVILAKPIIMFIYGKGYEESIIILQILCWEFLSAILSSFAIWTLAAIHQEKKIKIIKMISTFCYITLSLLLIPRFKTIGIAVSIALASFVSLIASLHFVKKFIPGRIFNLNIFKKIILINLLLGIILFATKEQNIFASIFLYASLYFGILLGLKIIKINEILFLKKIF